MKQFFCCLVVVMKKAEYKNVCIIQKRSREKNSLLIRETLLVFLMITSIRNEDALWKLKTPSSLFHATFLLWLLFLLVELIDSSQLKAVHGYYYYIIDAYVVCGNDGNAHHHITLCSSSPSLCSMAWFTYSRLTAKQQHNPMHHCEVTYFVAFHDSHERHHIVCVCKFFVPTQPSIYTQVILKCFHHKEISDFSSASRANSSALTIHHEEFLLLKVACVYWWLKITNELW